MFSFGTKWTYVAWRLMNQAVTYHFIFSFETLTALRTVTCLYRAVMGSVLRVNVHVRASGAVSIRGRLRQVSTSAYFNRYCV